MSTPIEQAALALYAADDEVVNANGAAKAHRCDEEPPDGILWCDKCRERMWEASRRQRSAEKALMLAVREARPRC
jgi:hypothetical protein